MSQFDDLVRTLDDAGLWAGLDPRVTAAALGRIRAGEPARWPGGAACPVDGEELSDGLVEDWLNDLTGSFCECGVELAVRALAKPAPGDTGDYAVDINGHALTLYATDPSEPGLPLCEDPWMDCTIKPAAVLNHLLSGSGSTHRLALFWPGGNDGFAVLGPEPVLRAAGQSRRNRRNRWGSSSRDHQARRQGRRHRPLPDS